MAEKKLLKAQCRKTGQYYCFEMEYHNGSWKAVNMVCLSDSDADQICSEICQDSYDTNRNLLPCVQCGGRKIGGCSCSKRLYSCSKGMKYKFNCTYCNELEIIYDRPQKRNRYTRWAGISNIPDAMKDRFGNPVGDEYDLVESGTFDGERILILNLCSAGAMSNVTLALKRKGFSVELIVGYVPEAVELHDKLRDACQLWIISHEALLFGQTHYQVIKEYFDAGHGLYVWGDNDPLNTNANFIVERMFKSHLSGDYFARKVLGIQKYAGGPGIIPDHLISTGIVSFYEGDTIAKIQISRDLKPLIYSSDGNIVTAYYEGNGKRALIDGAFTRLWDWDWGQTAGTERYIVNAAAWLANTERFGWQ